MALETGTYISDLVSTNPVGTDTLDKADDHLRLIKSTIQATFPSITGAVTLTQTELNKLKASGTPEFTAIELGNVSDTTITRSAAGVLAVEGGILAKENRANAFTAAQTITTSATAQVLTVRNGTSGGTASTTHGELVVESADANMGIQVLGTNTSNQKILFGDAAANDQGQIEYNHSSDYMAFYTAGAEKTRITSAGILLHGASATLNTASSTDTGVQVNSTGQSFFMASALAAVNVSRQTDDGNLMNFYQGGTVEGSISVSGTTISYNAFSGSHWSQLADGSRPEILVGTVVETIDQKCVWPGEDNDQLAKFKISDTPASKRVYGVFMAWDNDDDETNDAYITSLGAYLVRIAPGVTVQGGDLLESNGDGCARVQADDVIRSSTIGKVTAPVVTTTYPDGSYTVPCVLYCG